MRKESHARVRCRFGIVDTSVEEPFIADGSAVVCRDRLSCQVEVDVMRVCSVVAAVDSICQLDECLVIPISKFQEAPAERSYLEVLSMFLRDRHTLIRRVEAAQEDE